jgi:hypothetical protein
MYRGLSETIFLAKPVESNFESFVAKADLLRREQGTADAGG